MKLTETFVLNDTAYKATTDAAQMLRVAVPSAHKSGNYSAVHAIMFLGQERGEIQEMSAIQQVDARAILVGKVSQEVARELDSLSIMELHKRMKEEGCPSRLTLEARLVARKMSDA